MKIALAPCTGFLRDLFSSQDALHPITSVTIGRTAAHPDALSVPIPDPTDMNHHYALLVTLLICGAARGQSGGCIPPDPAYTCFPPSPARLCQGGSIDLDASTSNASPGHSVVQWVWRVGATTDTSVTPTTTITFPDPGLHKVTLVAIDDNGCASEESTPTHVLVSALPDFSGTLVPQTACEGQNIALNAIAVQPPMIGNAVACTAPDNGVPLPDNGSAPTTSTLQVAGQSNSLLTDIADLGDICMEIEHSYLGDLVLTVACPNGQSVVLHQQGGGSTFLGDANDDDNQVPVLGGCFQYCFGLAPEHGTLVQSIGNTIPVSQGNALPAGRYTSVQPLELLLGCPLNGTWTFSSTDMMGSDNGYLCGWCISFGEQPDSSFMDQGPVLGSSADSSFWSGVGVTNAPGQPGAANLSAQPGPHSITYSVTDSYGCTHEALFPIEVGDNPAATIVENTELGLLCAQPTGGFTYQWSYEGGVVLGAAGACFTPPGPGAVSVVVTSAAGCSATANLLGTGIGYRDEKGPERLTILPNPNDGTFSVRTRRYVKGGTLRVLDMTGRIAHEETLRPIAEDGTLNVALMMAPGVYFLQMMEQGRSTSERFVVR